MSKFSQATIYQLTQWLSHDVQVNDNSLDALQQEESYLPLIALANKFWLLGALIYQFKTKAVWQKLPDELQQYLSELEQSFKQRSTLIVQEIQLCAQLLSNEKIPCLLLKGAASLNNSTYQDISERFMADIDILVPQEYLDEAQATLKQNGFIEKVLPFDLSPINHHHLPPLIRQAGVCYVELHHQPLKQQRSMLLSSECAWQQSAPLPLDNNIKVNQLSPTFHLLVTIAHSEISDSNFVEAKLELRQLHNIYSIAYRFNDEIDWQVLKEKFSLIAKEQVLCAVIYKLERLFNFKCELTKLDDEFSQQHLQICIDKLVDSQQQSEFRTEFIRVCSGYKKDSILQLYGGKGSWSLLHGRAKHFYRHCRLGLRKIFFF